MSKSKYYYDKKSLSYKEVKLSKKAKLLTTFGFLFSSFFFGFLILFILMSTPILNTPTELAQERELNNFKIHMNLLNDRLQKIESTLGDLETRDNNIYRVLFEANPIDSDVRKAGFGGINRYTDLEGYDNSKLIIETTKKIDILTKQIVIQSKSLDEIENLHKTNNYFLHQCLQFNQ